MSPNEDNEIQLDRYLDGAMSDQEAAEFLQTVDRDQLKRGQEMQAQIEESLGRILSFEPFDEDSLVRRFLQVNGTSPSVNVASERSASVTQSNWIRVAIAACVLVCAGMAIWFNSGSGTVEPIFEPTLLALVHDDMVDRGFKPYYNCDSSERFAAEFSKRVAQPLALAQLPAGRSMLGISYPGGISRNTTAMLCNVDGENVTVFVDREGESGFSIATENNDTDLNIFIEEKNGLVFCEVTPLDSPSMIEYFEFVD
jgi:hypothetical protein